MDRVLRARARRRRPGPVEIGLKLVDRRSHAVVPGRTGGRLVQRRAVGQAQRDLGGPDPTVDGEATIGDVDAIDDFAEDGALAGGVEVDRVRLACLRRRPGDDPHRVFAWLGAAGGAGDERVGRSGIRRDVDIREPVGRPQRGVVDVERHVPGVRIAAVQDELRARRQREGGDPVARAEIRIGDVHGPIAPLPEAVAVGCRFLGEGGRRRGDEKRRQGKADCRDPPHRFPPGQRA